MTAKRHYTTYTKDEIRKSTAIIANQKTLEATLYLSKVKFDDKDDVNSYIVCEHCSFRSGQLDQHLKKWHNQTTTEYKLQFPNSVCVSKNASDRVTGDKNPAFGHGGRYSKFSKNFIKYDGLSDEEVKIGQDEVAHKSKKTKQENPQNSSTNIEYYLTRGFDESEGRKLLSERQSTFSLEKCIEKYGEIGGKFVWQARQDKWQETLNSKSHEDIEKNNRKKSNQSIYYVNKDITDGVLYFIKVKKDYYKIGISGNIDITERYSESTYEKIVYVSDVININKANSIEKLIKTLFTKYGIRKSNEIYPFGWTESFNLNTETRDKILSTINLLMDKTLDELTTLFEKYVRT